MEGFNDPKSGDFFFFPLPFYSLNSKIVSLLNGVLLTEICEKWRNVIWCTGTCNP